jgi:hypothetical protein
MMVSSDKQEKHSKAQCRDLGTLGMANIPGTTKWISMLCCMHIASWTVLSVLFVKKAMVRTSTSHFSSGSDALRVLQESRRRLIAIPDLSYSNRSEFHVLPGRLQRSRLAGQENLCTN